MVIVLASVCTAVLAAAAPLPLRVLIDNALGGEPVADALGSALERLGLPTSGQGLGMVAALAFAVLASLLAIGGAVTGYLWAVLGNRLVEQVTNRMFRSSMWSSSRFHRRIPPADQMVRMTTDNWAVYTVANLIVGMPATRRPTVFAVAIAAWQLDAALTVWLFALGPTLAFIARVVGRRLTRRSRAEAESHAVLTGVVLDTARGLPDVLHLDAGDRHREQFSHRGEQWRQQSIRSVSLTVWAQTINVTLTNTARALILAVGGIGVIRGATTVGTLIVFLGYTEILAREARSAATMHNQWRSSKAGIDRVDEMLETEPRAPSPVDEALGSVIVLPEGGVDVVFRGVGYAYGDEWVLDGVSLTASAGTVTALVGPTGAGKSTLVSLLPRLIDPMVGSIMINGVDHRRIPLGNLRQLIAVVRQDPYLFPASLRDNIAYGRPDASLEEIVAAARAANAHEFIEALPDGYETVVGDGGAGLSGGQRQRLAIARALLKDAPVLVLDEPTSALDAGTEAEVMDAIDRLVEGRTVLVIAHRLSTIRNADTIVVLDHGTVHEAGTHQELLAASGLYHSLYTTQFQDHPVSAELEPPSRRPTAVGK